MWPRSRASPFLITRAAFSGVRRKGIGKRLDRVSVEAMKPGLMTDTPTFSVLSLSRRASPNTLIAALLAE